MRFILLSFFFIIFLNGFSQIPGKILISGILINNDSIPIPDVAIINSRTGKTVRTNVSGYFQTEIEPNDSLLIFHIAFKKQFVGEKDNCRVIILKPEVQQIMQIDVTHNKDREQNKTDQIIEDVRRLAPTKTNSDYDQKSYQKRFIAEHGSHEKAFSPYFGPTTHLSTGEITRQISKIKKRKELKKMTSHYHLAKKKKDSEIQ